MDEPVDAIEGWSAGQRPPTAHPGDDVAFEVLGPLRHACHQCGGICQGSQVLVRPSERDRVLQQAAELGVADPLDGELLRKVDGACVFLGADRRCRVHGTWGEAAKPLVCRQYPLTALRVGDRVRLAVDPGCLHAWRSLRDGPSPEAANLIVSRVDQPEAWTDEEEALLDLLDERSTAEVLSILGREPVGVGGLPPKITARLLRALDRCGFWLRVAHPDTAPVLREVLRPVSEGWPALNPDAPGEWAIGEERDAWLVETARRFVFLRLAPDLPPTARALVVLTAGLATGFTVPDARFGPALAAFTRALRQDGRLLAPSQTAVQALLGRSAE